MSAHLWARKVHTHLVLLLADMINDDGRPVAEVAAEAGIVPSRLRRILARAEVLTVADLLALGQVLDFMPSDLLRLTEQRIGGAA